MALHTEQLNGIAVCAGNGGLELGLKLALGERYKTVCYIEREAYNAATLVARMEDAVLDFAPVWDDITTFDGKPWRGLVDIISAGFPCQPHSQAGLQKGTADERWLWDSIERTIGEFSPGIIFLENVPNLAFSGLDKVIGSLSKTGYHSVWDTFSAEETGASQERERLFILSYRNGLLDRHEQTERETWRNIVSSSRWENFPDCNGFGCESRREHLRWQTGTKINWSDQGSTVECADGCGCGQTLSIGKATEQSNSSIKELANDSCERRPDRRKSEFSRRTENRQTSFVFPPFRDDFDGWQNYLAERPDAQPAIRRSSDGLADRMDRIRTIGNGVVPLVVAYAFISLMRTALQIKV